MRSTAKGQSLGWKCQYRGSALGAAADVHPMQMSNDFWPPPVGALGSFLQCGLELSLPGNLHLEFLLSVGWPGKVSASLNRAWNRFGKLRKRNQHGTQLVQEKEMTVE